MNRKLSSSLELIPFCPRRIWESRTRYKLSMQTMYFLCFLLPDLELYMSFRLYWIPSFSSSPTNKDNQYQESKSLNQLQTHIATDIQSAKPVCPTDHKIIASWNKHPPCHLMYPPYHSVSPTEAELTLGSRSHLLSHLPPGVLRSLNLLPLRAGANITLCWSNHGKPTTRGTTAIVKQWAGEFDTIICASSKKWTCLLSLIIRYSHSFICLLLLATDQHFLFWL